MRDKRALSRRDVRARGPILDRRLRARKLDGGRARFDEGMRKLAKVAKDAGEAVVLRRVTWLAGAVRRWRADMGSCEPWLIAAIDGRCGEEKPERPKNKRRCNGRASRPFNNTEPCCSYAPH